MAARPIRVLLVDDDEDDFILTRELLRDIPGDGFALDWIPEYDQALTAICRAEHDVCLLDYRMGKKTGLDLLRDARERGCSIPVILLTGQGERAVDVAAMEAGAADFMEKSRLDSSLLDRVIRYSLQQKRHADELEDKVRQRTAALAEANEALQREIAERKRAEEALRESEARFRHLADAMPQIVWVIAVDGRLEFVNHRWREYSGLTLEQSQDRAKFDAIIHPADRERLESAAARALVERSSYQVEFRLKRGSDGAYRWFLARGVPVLNENGQVVRWYGTSTDIDDQKALENALREADRRKDQFLATLAHELRNPLPPIRNALEIMRLTDNDPVAVETGRAMIDRQLRQMVRLIDDLMDVSRISRGKVRLRRERVELAQIIHSAVETSQPLMTAQQHTLEVKQPARPIFLFADFTRLAQVVVNLLNNAAKYTDRGGRIELVVETTEREATIRVRDNGIGIAPEQLSHVFEMFAQIGRSEDRSQGGLGIGLSLVRALVEMHGGSVAVRSEGPGRGSEFTVRLPVDNGKSPVSDHS